MTEKEISGFSLRITQSSKTALTAITMEIAQVYVKDAIKAIDAFAADPDKDSAGDVFAADYAKAVRCASLCIDNLIASLDMEQKISYDLLLLYQYMKNSFRRLKRRPDKQQLEVMGRMLARLWQSFEELAKQDQSGPMMRNTQKVYAGLTYGQGTLNETYDSGHNRGYLA